MCVKLYLRKEIYLNRQSIINISLIYVFYFNNISSNETYLRNVFNKYFTYICDILIQTSLFLLLNFINEIYVDKIPLKNMSLGYFFIIIFHLTKFV